MRSLQPKLTKWRVPVIAALALGSAAITAGSVAYFDFDHQAPFVVEKLPLPHEQLWLLMLRTHVVAAALALPFCLALLSRTLLRRAPRAHRWLGRAAGIIILAALCPSGFYLALFAKGGRLGTVGFVLSGAIVVVATVRGVRSACAADFAAHRRWMLHVLAQLSVAVTSRALLFAFDAADMNADVAYLLSLWLPVLASAAVVEAVVPQARHVTRAVQINRELPSLELYLPHTSQGSMIHRLAILIVAALGLSWEPAHALRGEPSVSSSLPSASTPDPALRRELPAPAPDDLHAAALVQEKVVWPLEAEYAATSQFGRGRLPPRNVRARMLAAAARGDAAGGAFVPFAIDECRGALKTRKGDGDACEWHRDTLTGCVYPKSGAVFVRRGEETFPAALVHGVKVKAAPAYLCRG